MISSTSTRSRRMDIVVCGPRHVRTTMVVEPPVRFRLVVRACVEGIGDWGKINCEIGEIFSNLFQCISSREITHNRVILPGPGDGEPSLVPRPCVHDLLDAITCRGTVLPGTLRSGSLEEVLSRTQGSDAAGGTSCIQPFLIFPKKMFHAFARCISGVGKDKIRNVEFCSRSDLLSNH